MLMEQPRFLRVVGPSSAIPIVPVIVDVIHIPPLVVRVGIKRQVNRNVRSLNVNRFAWEAGDAAIDGDQHHH